MLYLIILVNFIASAIYLVITAIKYLVKWIIHRIKVPHVKCEVLYEEKCDIYE